ncbi:uncharacterized protein LOC132045832 [Lycium ferocissimum]|uniref:uncharacterized protein LOC132045832 n=1 Tax=Lycium ferocissimum TaxID=112874 RepID=UPI002814ED84|nr:uncharacterized protein LOC132045832 [Lycium ferocissimum]
MGDDRVYKKIDVALGDFQRIQQFGHVEAEYLNPSVSDHSPILVKCGQQVNLHLRPFRFYPNVMEHPGFHDTLLAVWQQGNGSHTLESIWRKLKEVKVQLKHINAYMASYSQKLSTDNLECSVLIEEERKLLQEIEKWSMVEEQVLRHKARATWIECGDSNSNLMGDCAAELPCLNIEVVRAGKCLTIQQQRALIQEVTDDEIIEAIKSMPKEKAPGVYGFPIEFFTKNWDTVKEDVLAAVKQFYATGELAPMINTTAITLIPKIPSPTKLKDYRPISCCTTLYKIISKVLTRRIKTVIADLVGPSQSAFVEGRSIFDNILFSHEIFKCYTRKWISPRCVLKVDLRKAYDTLEWGFLRQMLSTLGFPSKFTHWVMTCVSTVSYSLMLNARVTAPFPQRGVLGREILCLPTSLCLQWSTWEEN